MGPGRGRAACLDFCGFLKNRAGQALVEVLYTRPLTAHVLYGADGISEEMTATSRPAVPALRDFDVAVIIFGPC